MMPRKNLLRDLNIHSAPVTKDDKSKGKAKTGQASIREISLNGLIYWTDSLQAFYTGH